MSVRRSSSSIDLGRSSAFLGGLVLSCVNFSLRMCQHDQGDKLPDHRYGTAWRAMLIFGFGRGVGVVRQPRTW